MTLDTQLRDSFASAVDDTTVPPGFGPHRHPRWAAPPTPSPLGSRWRARRGRPRRRSPATQLPTSPTAHEGQVADAGTVTSMVALKWARSLPEGPAPTLPFYGEGGLWSDGTVHPVPASVNQAYPPRPVSGGWLVLLGQDESRLHLAVMSADGSLRDLPADTFAQGFGDARVEVSADGRRVAYGIWLVDVTTMQLTPVPHRPDSDEQDGYYTGHPDGRLHRRRPRLRGCALRQGLRHHLAAARRRHHDAGGPARGQPHRRRRARRRGALLRLRRRQLRHLRDVVRPARRGRGSRRATAAWATTWARR